MVYLVLLALIISIGMSLIRCIHAVRNRRFVLRQRSFFRVELQVFEGANAIKAAILYTSANLLLAFSFFALLILNNYSAALISCGCVVTIFPVMYFALIYQDIK